jgi:hypothetical protein
MRQRKVELTFNNDKNVHYFILVGNGEPVLNSLESILQTQKPHDTIQNKTENEEIIL